MLLGNQDMSEMRKFCRVWQYKSEKDGKFKNHNDVRCLVYNYCQMKYQDDKSENPQYKFRVHTDNFVDFKNMTETCGSITRKIRRVNNSHIRMRAENSNRVNTVFNTEKRVKKKNIDKTSYQWLDEQYVGKYGLRGWTWRTIIQGVINEHLNQLKEKGEETKIDAEYVALIWHTIANLAGITNLDRVPQLTDPEHIDVKLILTMYSLDTFLFSRLN